MHPPKEQRGDGAPLALILGAGVLAVSSAAVLIRLADEAPALVIAAYRMGLASAVLLPAALLYHRRRLAQVTSRQAVLMAASGGFLAIHFGTWISSLQYTSVASSVLLVTSSPIFVATASWAFLRERPLRQEVLGIALGVMGGVIVSVGDLSVGREELTGDLLAVAGAMAVTGYLLIGRKVRKQVPALAYAVVAYPMAAVLLLGAAVGVGGPFTGYGASTYLWLALVALVPQIVGHTSLNWALGHVRATGVAIAVMVEPIGASLLAWAVLSEAPSMTTVGGGALLLTGVFLALRRRG